MLSSDGVAWCVCPCIVRSTNKIFLHFTQQFLYIFHKTKYNEKIIEFGFCDIGNNQEGLSRLIQLLFIISILCHLTTLLHIQLQIFKRCREEAV